MIHLGHVLDDLRRKIRWAKDGGQLIDVLSFRIFAPQAFFGMGSDDCHE